MSTVDFGRAAMRDPETGDVYIDRDGSIITLEGEDVVRQECIVALLTIRGDEVIDTEYGFPLLDAMKNPFNVEWKTLIKSSLLSTLSPGKIPMLEEIVILDIRNDDGTVLINIVIKSINKVETQINLGVDELFQSNLMD